MTINSFEIVDDAEFYGLTPILSRIGVEAVTHNPDSAYKAVYDNVTNNIPDTFWNVNKKLKQYYVR